MRAIAGPYSIGRALFGPGYTATGVTADVVRAVDADEDGAGAANTTFDGCSPLTNSAAVAGKQISSTGAGTDSGSSYATLNAAGYAEVSFSTSGVRWLARTNNSSGTADVYLDGVKKATVYLYSDTTRYAQNVWEIRDLPETPHTIRIVRTGDKNADSIGRNITLDAPYR